MNQYKIYFLIAILLICSFLNSNDEHFTNLYLAEPTKCFSCENQLPHPYKYMGGRTKCFSCENQYARMYGPQYGSLGQPSKCFSCEKQLSLV